ncbi:pyrroloquinoline quinone biosynthesis protein PqqE [Porphyromonas gingivalis]|nr:pyrroloquinoline quinone biosynthesis protein PqqE [Porphyromonas gingivalis]
MREAVFKITNCCPCKCSFCESGNGLWRDIEDIVRDVWMESAQTFVNNGLEVAIISGGEPLLRADLASDMIKLFEKEGVFSVLNTSGVLFSRNSIDKMLCNLPNLVVFSIDSVNPVKHDRHRGIPNLFQTVLLSIQDIKKRIPDLSVGVRFVLTKHNFHDLPILLYLCSYLGIDCLKITNIENDSAGQYALSLEQIDFLFTEVIPKSLEVCKALCFQSESLMFDAQEKLNHLFKGLSPKCLSKNLFAVSDVPIYECPLKSQFCLIGADGNIHLGCEAEHQQYPILGNIQELDILELQKKMTFYKRRRLAYCIYCSAERNIQINFTNKCLKVNERCNYGR